MIANEPISRIHPVPKPPHDPTWSRLDALVGWHEATMVGLQQHPASKNLVLSPSSGSIRAVTDESGSFGGLVPPSNVALGPHGSLYLLDNTDLLLKRFDPCDCVFRPVPHFGGRGSGARNLESPNGIGILRGNLFLCDTGNNRLSIFALPELVLRTNGWEPDAEAKLNNGSVDTWAPFAVAFDRRDRVFISDKANNCVHRFSAIGFWEDAFAVGGIPSHLAIDCTDAIYVVVDANRVQVLDPAGNAKSDHPLRADQLRDRFPPMPFKVDAKGSLDLNSLCIAKGTGAETRTPIDTTFWFDANGCPISSEPEEPLPFLQRGCYISDALDSKLYRCQWHRLVLHGELPPGTTLRISTLSAETEQSGQQIASLPEEAWETNHVVTKLDKSGEWDGLIRSRPGRFLWLRVDFSGGGDYTPSIRSIKVEFPRISLRRYLPSVFGEDPVAADFTDRFLSLFDTTFRSIERQIDTQAHLFDPSSTPTSDDPKKDFLTWLASWIGISIDGSWPEAKKREFVRHSGRLFADRGTADGLWRTLLLFLGLERKPACCEENHLIPPGTAIKKSCRKPELPRCRWEPPPLILEHFKLRRWLFLGAGSLGDQAVLWGQRIVNRSQIGRNAQVGVTQLKTTQDPFRDPFHVYAHKFSVFVPAYFIRSRNRRRTLEKLIEIEKPSHAVAQLVPVEPRFRIGFQSVIGLDAVVGRYPEGITVFDHVGLGGVEPQLLGRDTVLSNKSAEIPTLRIGSRSRIGTTTLLD